MKMRLAVLLSLALLTPATVFAHESKVTAEGMSEEFATAEAMRGFPKGASVTETNSIAGVKTLGCRSATGAPSPTATNRRSWPEQWINCSEGDALPAGGSTSATRRH